MLNYKDSHIKLFTGDCRKMVEQPAESVQMVVTSPPYWGLRKYSGEQELIWGREKDCQHVWGERIYKQHSGRGDVGNKMMGQREDVPDMILSDHTCQLCGAWRGAYGLEPTPEMYVQHTIEIFEEVKRVLRKDGVCFVNCGDSYYASGGAHKPEHANPGLSKSSQSGGVPHEGQSGKRGKVLSGLKDDDSSSESPCDECVKIRLLRNSDKSDYPSQVSETSSVESSHSHKVSQPDHQDNLRSTSQGDRNEGETSGLYSSPDSPDGVAPFSQVSTNPESSEQPLVECLPKGDWFSSPDVLASLSLVFQGCGYRKVCPFFAQTFAGVSQESLEAIDSSHGIALTDGALASHTQGKVSDFSVPYPYYTTIPHLKAKDMCLIPQRLMIAFQDAGWWVRSDIIWSKPNPLPESVTDRPTNSHEYILMLTKSAKYYWDQEAVREPSIDPESFAGRRPRMAHSMAKHDLENYKFAGSIQADGTLKHGMLYPDRNLRSVWTFPTQPYPEAHFAVFPEKLPELCIKAATPEVGCCSNCGKPWVRITKVSRSNESYWGKQGKTPDDVKSLGKYGDATATDGDRKRAGSDIRLGPTVSVETLSWQPTCKCNADKVPSIVLDPFAGAGTTLWVAKKLNRKAVGYELSSEYCNLIVDRCRQQVLSL